MSEASEYDFIVIGGGDAGIAVSKAAALRGAKTLLIERSLLGGSGIWTASVPMKALIHVAKHAFERRRGHSFGLPAAPIALSESSGALSYIRETVRRISALEDVSALCENVKIEVLEGSAAFIGQDRIKVNGKALRAKNFVLCTGSHPSIPEIDGLENAGYLTSYTLFDLETLPDSIAIIGNDSFGVEAAQALVRLGCRVSLIVHSSHLLQFADPELTTLLAEILIEEGVELHLSAAVERIEDEGGKHRVSIRQKVGYLAKDKKSQGKASLHVIVDQILIANGNSPNIEELNLQKADIKTTKEGVWVDEFLHASNSKVWALGDVIGSSGCSRTAEYDANLVVNNALAHFHKKRDYSFTPSVIFTSPELAFVGLSEEQARLAGNSYEVIRYDFHHNHLGIIEGSGRGRIKAIIDNGGRLLGVHILGARAGELIQEATLAIQNGLTSHDLVRSHRVYPSSGIAWNHLFQTWCAAHPAKHPFPFFK